MAEGIKISPKFDDLNFLLWKVKMTIFFAISRKPDCKGGDQTL